MLNKQEHLKLIKEKGRFVVDCSHDIFSNEQIEILEKYGHWFMALTTGKLEPITDLQRDFVLVATHKKEAFSLEEIAWFRYLGRKAVEAKHGDRLKHRYQPEDDTFYNREMVTSQRRMMFGEMKKNHNM